MPPQPRHRGARTPDRILFPLAALFALATIPLWLTLRASLTPAWHGHEMLFGYALAVVAGFLVTRSGNRLVTILVVTWFMARIAAAWAHGLVAALIGLSFPLALLLAAAPPLLRGAKRGENRIAPVVLAALLVIDAFWWSGAVLSSAGLQQRALLAAIDLLALLMLVVGGRALPAAVGGYLERHGIPRKDMIRSGGYELPLAAMMGVSCVSDLAGWGVIAGILNITAALITLWRARAWQLRYVFKRPELWSLALAYLWLIPALVLKGLAQLAPWLPVTHALHGFTVGALGALTTVMMARTAVLRARRPLLHFHDVGAATLLITLAALLRLVAIPSAPWREELLWLSAGAWMLAFLVLLLRLLRTARP